jgi:ribokinase
VVASGANYALAAADVEAMRKVFQGASLALFQLETPLDTVAAALALAREEGLRTMLDPAPAQPLPAELLALRRYPDPQRKRSADAAGPPSGARLAR